MFWPDERIAVGIVLGPTAMGGILALLLASYGVQGAYLVFFISVVLALAWGRGSAGIAATVISCLLT
jgi:hypothetical protein